MISVTNVTNPWADEPTSAAWTLARAKARLSEVIDRARMLGPQLITRHGRPAAVVVGAEEWERKTRRSGSLADFFAASPLRDTPDLIVERSTERARDDVV